MDLEPPSDFLILEALHSYGRNVAQNLARMTGEETAVVEERLKVLSRENLVTKIGPVDEAGLFEITKRGRVALRLRDDYTVVENFEALVNQHLATSDTGSATAIVRGKRKQKDE